MTCFTYICRICYILDAHIFISALLTIMSCFSMMLTHRSSPHPHIESFGVCRVSHANGFNGRWIQWCNGVEGVMLCECSSGVHGADSLWLRQVSPPASVLVDQPEVTFATQLRQRPHQTVPLSIKQCCFLSKPRNQQQPFHS